MKRPRRCPSETPGTNLSKQLRLYDRMQRDGELFRLQSNRDLAESLDVSERMVRDFKTKRSIPQLKQYTGRALKLNDQHEG